MELQMKFEDSLIENKQEKLNSHNRKLVPWLTWNEWRAVYNSIFSDSPDSVAFAFNRISAWRSRGCLPVVIEVTTSIIEIQQRDPFFKNDQYIEAPVIHVEDQSNFSLLSEEMLAMLYCMAIMRLVNGIVEKTRKKTQVSIAVAADAIGLPRTLIDVRHEGSHRELPSLHVVRSASVKALSWLKLHYWEPQNKAIFQGDRNAAIEKDIKITLRKLVVSLKAEKSQIGTPVGKGKCSKMKSRKTLKVLVQLYSSFSSEFVYVLLEFLLKALNSSITIELPEDSKDDDGKLSLREDLKILITKLSNKEPELLLDLLKAVLQIIETKEDMKDDTESLCVVSPGHKLESFQAEHLSSLFEWLVEILKGIKPRQSRTGDFSNALKVSLADAFIQKGILMELLRKCLLVSTAGNEKLMRSAIHLTQLIGDGSLMAKLNKLSLLIPLDLHVTDEENSPERSFVQLEEAIHEESKKLEMVKLHKMKKLMKPTDSDVTNSGRWVVTRSWNQCPVGMLPCSIGSSGSLPVLDYDIDHMKAKERSESQENWIPNKCRGKRVASFDNELPNNLNNIKKMKETVECCQSDGEEAMLSQGVDGRLMIGGTWEKVSQENVISIQSNSSLILLSTS